MEWYDYMNPHDQPEFKCCVCEKPLHDDERYCSHDCFKADIDSVFHSYIVAYWQTTGSAPLTPTI